LNIIKEILLINVHYLSWAPSKFTRLPPLLFSSSHPFLLIPWLYHLLLLFILSLYTPSPLFASPPSWCFLSLCPFCLPLRSFSFASSPFLASFSSSFSFPSWCLFYPSSPLPVLFPPNSTSPYG